MKNKPLKKRPDELAPDLAKFDGLPGFCAEFPGEFPWTVPDTLDTEFGAFNDFSDTEFF